MSVIASTIWPYVAGFAIPTLPAVVYFLSVSPAYPLIYDVVILQARNYSRGRNLPFPGIHFKTLDELVVYVPIVTFGASILALLSRRFQNPTGARGKHREHSADVERNGLIVTLSLLALVMFFQGLRARGIHCLCSLRSFLLCLLIALLFEHRAGCLGWRGFSLFVSFRLLLFTAAFSAAKATRHLILEGSVPGRIAKVLFASGKHVSENEATWCALSNPLTKGFCFFGDEARLKTIEFI